VTDRHGERHVRLFSVADLPDLERERDGKISLTRATGARTESTTVNLDPFCAMRGFGFLKPFAGHRRP